MVGRHLSVARAEEVDLLLTVDETEVGDRVDEILRVLDHPVADGVAPELKGLLELVENLDRFVDIDFAVGPVVRRVAQFAEPGVAGAGIVPTVGGFHGQLLRDLVKLNLQAGVQLLKDGTKGCRHDTASDEDDIGVLNMIFAFHFVFG